VDLVQADLVELLLEEVQVEVAEASVVCQPKDFLEADLLRQHPSQSLVEAVIPVLDG